MQTLFENHVTRLGFVTYPSRTADFQQRDFRFPVAKKDAQWSPGKLAVRADYNPHKGEQGNIATAKLLWWREGNPFATMSLELSAIKAVEFPRKDQDLCNVDDHVRVVRLIFRGEYSRSDLETTIKFSSSEDFGVYEQCAKFVFTLYELLGPHVVPPLMAMTSKSVAYFCDSVLGIVVLNRAETTLTNMAPIAVAYGSDYTAVFDDDKPVENMKRELHREGMVNIMIGEDLWREWTTREHNDSFLVLQKNLCYPEVVVYLHDDTFKRHVNTNGEIKDHRVRTLSDAACKAGGFLRLKSLERDYNAWHRMFDAANVPEPVSQVNLLSDPPDKEQEAKGASPQEPNKRGIDALVKDFLEEHKRMRAEWETTEKVLKDHLQHARKQRDALFKKLQGIEDAHKCELDEAKETARAQTATAAAAVQAQHKAEQRAQEALDLTAAQTSVAQRALKWRVVTDSGDLETPSMALDQGMGCVVCYDAMAEYACVPCGHIVACRLCKDNDTIWKMPKCPLCNQFRFPDDHGLVRVFPSGVRLEADDVGGDAPEALD
tara:strand:+ start:500 stop:2137 length:1638 start_codon:yes stop_codon:yes gene_type:complete